MEEQSQDQSQEGQQSEWIGTPPDSEPAEGQVAPAPDMEPAPEEEPLPGDEPVAEDDFAAAEDAAEHPEMDDAERDGVDLDEAEQAQPAAPEVAAELQQERVEDAVQAREERHSGEQQNDSAA